MKFLSCAALLRGNLNSGMLFTTLRQTQAIVACAKRRVGFVVVHESSCDSQAGGLSIAAPTREPWLAAYTRPNHEEKVRVYCQDRGIEAFLPTREIVRRWSDRKRTVRLPLFPSYVFLRLNEEQRARAVQAPGFLWFVHDRRGPVPILESELEALRRALACGFACDPLPSAQVGDEVEIVAGAMRGVRGRLLRKDPGALVLGISAIQASVRVRVQDPRWLVPVFRPRPARRAVGLIDRRELAHT